MKIIAFLGEKYFHYNNEYFAEPTSATFLQKMLDDGKTKEEIILDKPDTGLHINSFIWREMHDFSEDCVLMVLASELYDERVVYSI
ncbi:FdtA/QdtA family cupin domain-containing protein [Providencia stuartii]|uniref:sugar 3,4-ketoisomerase n=1 Tax=Providencia stuartii TaxID=588 RepID=UPI0033645C4A